MNADIRTIALELIQPSPFNQRKKFDQAKIDELADSLRQHGLLSPLIVRPINGSGRFELVAGERRWRSCGVAGLTEVDVIVRELSDNAAEEVMLIENLQREDLTAGEEADGYARLLDLKDEAGQSLYTHESLAAKIGKPVVYVRRRLKLRQSPKILLDAIDGGLVAVSVAELVGRIPDPKAREEAAKKILKPVSQEIPLNYEQARDLIREEFMLNLKGCGFPLDDDTLVPIKRDHHELRIMGGACDDCPFRSGNNQDLQDELATAAKGSSSGGRKAGIDPNVCTNPGCYRAKQRAAWEITRRLAEAAGQRVIADDAARRVFNGRDGALAYDSEYALLEEAPKAEDVNYVPNPPKWKKLVEGANVPVIVALNPHTGKQVHLIERKVAIEAVKSKAKEADEPSLFDKKKTASDPGAKAEREKAKFETEVTHEAMRDLVGAISRNGVGIDEQMLLFEIALDNSGADGQFIIGKMLGIQLQKNVGHSSGRDYAPAILKHVRDQENSKYALEGWTVLAMLAKHLKWSGVDGDDFKAVAKAYRLDIKQIGQRVKTQLAVGKKGKGKVALDAKDLPKNDEPQLGLDLGSPDPDKTPNLRDLMKKGVGPGDFGRGPSIIVTGDPSAFSEAFLKPSRSTAESPPNGQGVGETWAYHCDCCSALVNVFSHEYAEVEKMASGDFCCMECMEAAGKPPLLGYPLINIDERKLYEDFEGDPFKAISVPCDQVMAPHELAEAIVDGTMTFVAAIGPTPKKGSPGHKEHEAKRVKLARAVKKLQEERIKA